MFSEFSDPLPYYPLERKTAFYKLFFLSRYSFDSFEFFDFLPFPEMFQILPFPEMSQILPFPEMFQILPFPEMFRISPIDRKSRDIPENSKLSDFVVFRVGRGVRGCSCLCLYFVFCIFYIFFSFVFCILYFYIYPAIPSSSSNPSNSSTSTPPYFPLSLYIDIFPVFSPYYPLERYIIFCLHISNLSTKFIFEKILKICRYTQESKIWKTKKI